MKTCLSISIKTLFKLPFGKMSRTFSCAFTVLYFTYPSNAQSFTEQDAIKSAMTRHPSMQIADMEVRMQRALEKSAFNPEQPELAFEFPTDVGLSFDLRQTFDFPSVYSARKNWLKAQTNEQEQRAGISRYELMRDVRLAYLKAQIAIARKQILAVQDSLWNSMDSISLRLYAGGHINKADELYSSKQAGLMHQSYLNAQAIEQNALSELALFTYQRTASLEPLARRLFSIPDTTGSYYFESLFTSQESSATKELDVHRAQRLPDLIVGYLRVPEIDTDYRSRFNAGVTIPIWQGQYKAEVDRTKIALDKLHAEEALWKKNADVMTQQLLRIWNQTGQSLDWYENSGLPQSDELVSAYQRLYGGGEVDYALTLRNIAEAVEIHLSYLETLERHNEAVIGLEYLFGK
jgi:cobalt-zinc-cadmium resistance protein CzcA